MNYLDIWISFFRSLRSEIDKKLEKAKFDKTFNATVIGKVSENKYEIFYRGKTFIVPCDASLSTNQTVKVCAPQNNWNELFIVGIVETNADTGDRSFDKTYKGTIIEADNKNQEYVVSINGTQRKLKSDFFYYVGSEVTVRAIQGDFSNLYLEMNKDNDIYI